MSRKRSTERRIVHWLRERVGSRDLVSPRVSQLHFVEFTFLTQVCLGVGCWLFVFSFCFFLVFAFGLLAFWLFFDQAPRQISRFGCSQWNN